MNDKRVLPKCDHCGADIFWGLPQPNDPCIDCGNPVRGEAIKHVSDVVMRSGRWYVVINDGLPVSTPMMCEKVTDGVPTLAWPAVDEGELLVMRDTYPPDEIGLLGGLVFAEIENPLEAKPKAEA